MIGTGFFKNNTYDKVRSDYAQEVADYIRRNFIQADNPLSVVEVGAGSGKFTNSVIASNYPDSVNKNKNYCISKELNH